MAKFTTTLTRLPWADAGRRQLSSVTLTYEANAPGTIINDFMARAGLSRKDYARDTQAELPDVLGESGDVEAVTAMQNEAERRLD